MLPPTMNAEAIIEKTKVYVRSRLVDAEGGHDWFHIERVHRNAVDIARHEPCDPLVVELGALLHDVADSKFHGGDEMIGPRLARELLTGLEVAAATIDHVVAIIENVSFKGGNHQAAFTSIEHRIVQDADRLDALGAVGIARAFNYGGFKNRPLHDPGIPPKLDMTREEYKASVAPTTNHFHEKLLLLRDRMNTARGRQLAEGRHRFMEAFLDEFHAEWNGER
jgi:uncharacterized protein